MPEPVRCFHCDIEINPQYDVAAFVRIDGQRAAVCDSCFNDYLVYGENFGDDVRGECLHTKWAAEDTLAMQAMEGEAT